MSSKPINYESEYKSLKGQYDALLDKNQNDVIRIKQREKQLTVFCTYIPGGTRKMQTGASVHRRNTLKNPRISAPGT
jgi:hypothetical protein